MRRYDQELVILFNGEIDSASMDESSDGDWVEYAEIERIKRILAGPGTSAEKIEAIAEVVK